MILMSSFCLEFLVIVALLSMYSIVPDPLFISGDASHSSIVEGEHKIDKKTIHFIIACSPLTIMRE